MRIDTALDIEGNLTAERVIATAKQAEALGYGALWTREAQHDPFLPLVLAAEHTSRLQLGTGIAVAFARSPMSLAQIAWDLQRLSHGRFILGLGTQVKAHIERRFGMTWDHPAPRLRDYILALRAIWHSWQTGTPLNFRGQFFKLTLMSPFFNPGPIEQPQIPIYIAGVNEHLCQLAGELCEGFHVHPLHTPKYLAEFIWPQLEIGLQRSERAWQALTTVSSAFVIAGDTPAERAAMRERVRQQISFYASTPTYYPVFALHGWKSIAEQLSSLAARGKWPEMPRLITDDMLAIFAPEGTWAEMPALLQKRYQGMLDRVTYYFEPATLEQQQAAVAGFQPK